jgi:hypothetical protein
MPGEASPSDAGRDDGDAVADGDGGDGGGGDAGRDDGDAAADGDGGDATDE